jgi:hypothetical protein
VVSVCNRIADLEDVTETRHSPSKTVELAGKAVEFDGLRGRW